jgi:hypothetical protein
MYLNTVGIYTKLLNMPIHIQKKIAAEYILKYNFEVWKMEESISLRWTDFWRGPGDWWKGHKTLGGG